MKHSYMPFVILLTVSLFFGVLIWFDSAPGYTQDNPATLYPLTSWHGKAVSGEPRGFTELNGAVYFGLESEKGGLWKTDGTEAGTILVKDVKVDPGTLEQAGNLLYFVTYDEVYHTYLWRSDGTTEGTILLSSSLTIDTTQADDLFTAVGDIAYFAAAGEQLGVELWQSDGTAEGTTLVADIVTGAASSSPRGLTAVGDTLLFTIEGGRFPFSLWQSDGTSTGTFPVPNSEVQPHSLVALQDVLYFVGTDALHGDELWRYALGDAAPMLVAEIAPGSQGANIDNLVVANGQLFFEANDGVHGNELWQSSGTAADTKLVKDIAPGSADTNIWHITGAKNLIYFVADAPDLGRELWKSDGTAAGTQLVKDILSGPDGAYPFNLGVIDANVYFLARNAKYEIDLWRSDGTDAGTTILKESLKQFNVVMQVLGNMLYFGAHDDAYGTELWASDGTAEGTTFVKDVDINHYGPPVRTFVRYDNQLYFMQDFESRLISWFENARLWRSAGTGNLARQVDEQIRPSELRELNGDLYISGYDDVGPALWKQRGITNGPELVRRFISYAPRDLLTHNDLLFFFAKDNPDSMWDNRYDFWRSDGTIAGTVKLIPEIQIGELERAYPVGTFSKWVIVSLDNTLWSTEGMPEQVIQFTPAGIDGAIRQFMNTPNSLYFVTWKWDVDNFRYRYQLWRTNGTPAGTEQLAGIEDLQYIDALEHIGNEIYLIGDAAGRYGNLWYGDGVSQELVRLTNHRNSSAYNYEFTVAVMDEELYFVHEDNVHGPELWKSAGAVENTVLVKDITPDDVEITPWAYPGPLFSFGNRIFFGAHDGVHGKELWQSDGTPAGTTLVKDINPGRASSWPQQFMGRAGFFFFTANDGVNGRELWRSDGTPAGTMLVEDIYPGLASAKPEPQMIFGNTLYFTANNGLDGRQLLGLYDPGIPLALPIGEEPRELVPHEFFMPLMRR